MNEARIGKPVRREEDFRLLRGRGRYADDVNAPDQARAYVLRSPHAHAEIRRIDTRAALQSEGVLAVLTGEDLAARGLGALVPAYAGVRSDGRPGYACSQPLLARGRARFAGEPVAFVLAETVDQAKDAAERIAVDYAPLPAVIGVDEALAASAPALWGQPRQRRLHLRDRRCGGGRRRDRRRGPCHPPSGVRQPGDRKRAGDPRLYRILRRR